ncbi:MAG: YicC/YloC family endoribonuclease [Pirellulaceae bacterium]|nr:YicC family protein [Pirellulales bacterium]
MLLSMTGQGVATVSDENATLTIEIRAVNNRHLKINLRAPDSLIAHESSIEKQIRSVVGRGTINVNIKVMKHSRQDDFTIDTELLQAYQAQLRSLSQTSPSLESLLGLPGVVINNVTSESSVASVLTLSNDALQQALGQFNAMRETEGNAIEAVFNQQLDSLKMIVEQIKDRAPVVVTNYQERLTDKINKLLETHDVTLNEGDLAREIGLHADRCDITEEVVRLNSHLEQFRNVMQSATSQGRKLDFITQELFREVNTIGSKANDTLIANSVVEAKTIIERIREQVQNIE